MTVKLDSIKDLDAEQKALQALKEEIDGKQKEYATRLKSWKLAGAKMFGLNVATSANATELGLPPMLVESKRQMAVKKGLTKEDKRAIVKAHDKAENKAKFMREYTHEGNPLKLSPKNILDWKDLLGLKK
jgi:hypothetical protein